MSDTAQILQFPAKRVSRRLQAPAYAPVVAREYWNLESEARTPEVRNDILSNPDVLVSVLGLLRDLRETKPKAVAEEASAIYCWIEATESNVGIFDERDYFLAESAYLAGSSSRLLGDRENAMRWLDRAEANFRHTVNPAPGLANVAYARVALGFDMGHFGHVLEAIPLVRSSFERLGMSSDAAKSLLLEAMALKCHGQVKRALGVLEPVRGWEETKLDPALKGRIVSELGDLYQLDGRFELAMTAYGEALDLLRRCETTAAIADLKMFVGEAYRERNSLTVALEAFRAAAGDYQELGLTTRLAYLRIFIADTLLRLNRNREAEWEILASLPIIEEQKMVPEGFVALSILKESVRRRKTDPTALRELREHLKARA